MLKSVLIAINSGYVHSNLAVRQISNRSGIPFFEFNINMAIEDVVPKIVDYDILCFSCYIWNIAYVQRLTEYIKKIDRNKVIVAGGPAVSFNGKEVMEECPYIDYVVCGEGEDVTLPLIECISSGSKPDIPGILYKSQGAINGSDQYIFAKRLECVPYKADIVYFESSRGCPFSCTYCLSGFEQGGVRYYDMDEVKAALTKLSKMDVPIVKFVDRTFNANERRTAEILEHLLTLNSDTIWHFEIGGDLLTDRIINLLNKGRFQVEIGIQSFNEDTLKKVRRHCNLDKLCENISRLNIHKHIDLIAGLPMEDMPSFISSFNRAFALKADMLQLGFLKVLPGSELRNDDSITYSKYPPYRVVKTKWLSFKELHCLERLGKAVDIYYNKGRFTLSLEYLLGFCGSAYELFSMLADGLGERLYYPVGQAVAAENMFNVGREISDSETLKELMRCDYYFSGAKGNKPIFMEDIPYKVKDIRRRLGIGKDESFFITGINYRTLEKAMYAVIKGTGQVIVLEDEQ